MIHIAFISTNHAWGGSEVLWTETAILLNRQGVNITVGIPDWKMPFNKRIVELQKNATEFFFNYDDREYVIVDKTLPLIKRIFNRFLPQKHQLQPNVEKIRNKNFIFNLSKPDLVVFSLGRQKDFNDAMLYCVENQIKYVIVFQLINEYEFFYEYDLIEKIRFICKNATKTYFVSNKNAEIFEQRIGLNLQNKEVIFNPVNLNKKGHLPYPTVEPTYNVACVANLMMLHKGHDILFSIFSQEKWRNRNIKLHLYGSGIHEEFLNEWKERDKLDNIEFHGFYTDIEEIWAKNHALILCTRMEGMPLCLMEAMQMKRMAITTDKGGNKELIEDGITGFLSLDANEILFDEAMERAWNYRECWEELGKNAYIKVNEVIPENPVEYFANKLLNLIS